MVAEDERRQSSGGAWGDDITSERQAELEQRLQAWEQEADHGERTGPFDRIGLSYGKRARDILVEARIASVPSAPHS